MKKLFLLVMLGLGLSLGGCGKSEADKAKDAAEMQEIKVNRMAREFVSSHLKDPSSAQFRNQIGFCGEVNSKNSFGAYTGFKRFIATDKNLVIMQDNLSPHEFQAAWNQVCK